MRAAARRGPLLLPPTCPTATDTRPRRAVASAARRLLPLPLLQLMPMLLLANAAGMAAARRATRSRRAASIWGGVGWWGVREGRVSPLLGSATMILSAYD